MIIIWHIELKKLKEYILINEHIAETNKNLATVFFCHSFTTISANCNLTTTEKKKLKPIRNYREGELIALQQSASSSIELFTGTDCPWRRLFDALNMEKSMSFVIRDGKLSVYSLHLLYFSFQINNKRKSTVSDYHTDEQQYKAYFLAEMTINRKERVRWCHRHWSKRRSVRHFYQWQEERTCRNGQVKIRTPLSSLSLCLFRDCHSKDLDRTECENSLDFVDRRHR